jgi:leucyl-tRNA synthetase
MLRRASPPPPRRALSLGERKTASCYLPAPVDERYDAREVETRWQRVWEERGLFRAGRTPDAPKDYVLEMFPYPSGAMHMGHARVYSIGDVLARYSRLRGRDVLHPMGYDALGLPAENAAIRDGVHPAERTARNIEAFRAEMKSMGFSFDWSREFATSDPAFYRWNQWFFLKMLERDLVYRRQGWVNWCPGCRTVLANEQVQDGVCWRGHPGVFQKLIWEWAYRITRYADALLAGLDRLTEWPERITAMQRNWIGRSEGAEVDFPVESGEAGLGVRIYTTRIDTIHGCTYLVLAPEHPLLGRIVQPAQAAAVSAFTERMLRVGRAERTGQAKEGVNTGAFAKNPFTGERLPVWIANYVLADYGTGSVMAVPAHDQRDFEFAKAYGLPIQVVVQPAGESLPAELEAAYTEDGVLVHSGAASGLTSAAARKQLTQQATAGGFGRVRVNYTLRDWGFSRQRYWGTPIPVVYCPSEGTPENPRIVPVPYDQLPVKLPTRAVLTGEGEPPLAKVPEFIEVSCPSCGKPARREADTMDTFVDSSWYFGRFLSPHDEKQPFEPSEAKHWFPIDTYIGGPEHAVLHLLYFRFWTRVMRELGLCTIDEPARRLITQGIVLGPDGEKMSKSRGNVVSPTPYLRRFGADTVRLFVLFAGPVERDFAWNDSQVEGMHRFVTRVWRLSRRFGALARPGDEPGQEKFAIPALRRAAHASLRKVTDDLEKVHLNTPIAALMELTNAISLAMGPDEQDRPLRAQEHEALHEAFEILAVGLSPFAPHLAEELWSGLGHAQTLIESGWRDADPALLVAETLAYAVQVNGKLRGEIQVPVTATREEIEALARQEEKVVAQMTGKSLRKTIFVERRLVNFVVG